MHRRQRAALTLERDAGAVHVADEAQRVGGRAQLRQRRAEHVERQQCAFYALESDAAEVALQYAVMGGHLRSLRADRGAAIADAEVEPVSDGALRTCVAAGRISPTMTSVDAGDVTIGGDGGRRRNGTRHGRRAERDDWRLAGRGDVLTLAVDMGILSFRNGDSSAIAAGSATRRSSTTPRGVGAGGAPCAGAVCA